eukprot:6744721-Prorocentrum_lima.AAC.1
MGGMQDSASAAGTTFFRGRGQCLGTQSQQSFTQPIYQPSVWPIVRTPAPPQSVMPIRPVSRPGDT